MTVLPVIARPTIAPRLWDVDIMCFRTIAIAWRAPRNKKNPRRSHPRESPPYISTSHAGVRSLWRSLEISSWKIMQITVTTVDIIAVRTNSKCFLGRFICLDNDIVHLLASTIIVLYLSITELSRCIASRPYTFTVGSSASYCSSYTGSEVIQGRTVGGRPRILR